ncbi:MAG: TIGR01906 family membrane protein [Lachnospiraceae bacterium]|nr:TIGR01906 family membrane protein [Lachnospiraceae bacterium]
MTQNRFWNFLCDVEAAVVLFLFILSFSVTFTLNFRPLYYMDIELLEIEERSGIPKEEIKENYDVLIDYNSMFNDGELSFPTLAMSETGKIHFEEVKDIFTGFQKMAVVTAILGVVAVFENRKNRPKRYLKYTGVVTILIPALLGAAMAVNWDKAFVIFHKIAFDNDYWIFDAKTDPVITILPDTFFLHCAAMIIGLVMAGSVLCFVLYAISRRKLQEPEGLTKKVLEKNE